MVEFIELLFITSLWIWGMHGFMVVTDLPRTLYIKSRIKVPEWIRKPLFECPPCMSSIHGTTAFSLFHHDLNLLLLPIFCFCLCGLNYIIKEYLYGS